MATKEFSNAAGPEGAAREHAREAFERMEAARRAGSGRDVLDSLEQEYEHAKANLADVRAANGIDPNTGARVLLLDELEQAGKGHTAARQGFQAAQDRLAAAQTRWKALQAEEEAALAQTRADRESDPAPEPHWPNITREDSAVLDRLKEILSPDDFEMRRQMLAAEASRNSCYCRRDGRECVCTGGGIFQSSKEGPTTMGTTHDRNDDARDDSPGAERERMIQRKKDGYVPAVTGQRSDAGEPDAATARAAMIARKQNAYTPGRPSKAANGGTVADPGAASPSPSLSRDPSARGPQRDDVPQENDPGNARETSFERAKAAGEAKARSYEQTASQATENVPDAAKARADYEAKRKSRYQPAGKKP